MMNGLRTIAYFSMEIAVASDMPTYAGGLGVLAGDTLRSAADKGLPLVAVTLLHRKGYLRQRIDQSGWQHSEPDDWPVENRLTEMPVRVEIMLEKRLVHLRCWRYDILGVGGSTVPVLFLDTDLPENTAWDRTITHFLYGGDAYYRLCQEAVLGFGGVRMLRALGHDQLQRFHMNEGHSSLLTLELLAETAQADGRRTVGESDIAAVKARCIFTTHTPVTAAQDQFPMDLIGRVIGLSHGSLDPPGVFGHLVLDEILDLDHGSGVSGTDEVFRHDHVLNLTYLALRLSHYINGVAKRHAEVSRRMFSKYRVDEITNGVHCATWVAPALRSVFDRHIPGWEKDNFSLRYAHSLPEDELWNAHMEAKRHLLETVRIASGTALDPEILTLGFARRFTPYKRADLLLNDPERLKTVAARAGRLQVIYAGKAHPQDQSGKEIIQHILRTKEALEPDVRIVYLKNYDIALARILTAGADIWLNTPLPPLEASGTSGMKAAVNGVPSLSILDGWWLEGCIEGATGWSFGDAPSANSPAEDHGRAARDAASLYDKLEATVIPIFYQSRGRYVSMMRQAVAVNGSFFNTQRMIQEYALKAYI